MKQTFEIGWNEAEEEGWEEVMKGEREVKRGL